MIADDLFAGAGGWDLAAAELGIHARGVENMKDKPEIVAAPGYRTTVSRQNAPDGGMSRHCPCYLHYGPPMEPIACICECDHESEAAA